MRLPIDTSRLQFLVVAPAEPLAVPGEPKVGQGEMVHVDGLTAQAWEMEGRSGMAFRCHAIHSAAGRAAEKAA